MFVPNDHVGRHCEVPAVMEKDDNCLNKGIMMHFLRQPLLEGIHSAALVGKHERGRNSWPKKNEK